MQTIKDYNEASVRGIEAYTEQGESKYFTLYQTDSLSVVVDLTKGYLFAIDAEKVVFGIPLDPAKIAINFSDSHTDAKLIKLIEKQTTQ